MNPDFYLIFCDPITKENEIEIPFTLTGSDVSWRWHDYLYEAIYVRKLVAKNNRWSNWKTNADTPEKACERINYCLSVCRKYHSDLFDIEAKPNMPQQHFNLLHTYFEKYRGEIFNPHEIFKTGCKELRECIEQLNIDIHLLETMPKKHIKRANFNFKTGVMGILGPNEYKDYEFDRKANTLYLQYNMRGKTLYDVFDDDDDLIGEHHIKRAEWMGADFSLNVYAWTEDHKKQRIEDLKQWWHRKRNFLANLGFYEGDPANTLGWIPLASTEYDLDSLLEPRQFLKGARFW